MSIDKVMQGVAQNAGNSISAQSATRGMRSDIADNINLSGGAAKWKAYNQVFNETISQTDSAIRKFGDLNKAQNFLLKSYAKAAEGAKSLGDEERKRVETVLKLKTHTAKLAIQEVKRAKMAQKVMNEQTMASRVAAEMGIKNQMAAAAKAGGGSGMMALATALAKGFSDAAATVTGKTFGMLQNIMANGWGGILSNAKSMSKMMGHILVDKKWGDALGKMSGLLVAAIQFALKDAIAQSQMDVRQEAYTGVRAGEEKKAGVNGDKMRGIMFSRQQGKEWGTAVLQAGLLNEHLKKSGNSARTVQMEAYRLGKGMGMSGGAFKGYLDKIREFGLDAQTTMHNVAQTFQMAKNAAVETGLSTRLFTKAVQDSAVEARMLNVDVKAVSNTTMMLAKNQKKMGVFGIGKGDIPKLTKEMTSFQGHMSEGMQAFTGMRLLERMGLKGDAVTGIMAQQYGVKTATSMRFDEAGNLSAGGANGRKAFGGVDSAAVTSERLQDMKSFLTEQTAGAGSAQERVLMAQKLGQQMGISKKMVMTLLSSNENQLKDLANQEDIKTNFMSAKEIAGKTLSVGERSEAIQRAQLKATVMMAANALIQAKLAEARIRDKPEAEIHHLETLADQTMTAGATAQKQVFSMAGGMAMPFMNQLFNAMGVKGSADGGNRKGLFSFSSSEDMIAYAPRGAQVSNASDTRRAHATENEGGVNLTFHITGNKINAFQQIQEEIEKHIS